MIPVGILTAAATSSFSFLLDLYPGASVAYSLRKLKNAYIGNCVRIRRSSDNAEQDFGFISNYLDTTAISTFCGAGNGFVVTWYDQSGNANNAFNGSAATQPQIYFSGAFVIISGEVYIKFIPGKNLTFVTAIFRTATENYSFWITYEKDSAGNQTILLNGGGSYIWLDYGQTAQFINDGLQVINLTPNNYLINTRYLVNHICDTSIITNYTNGNAWGNVTTTFPGSVRSLTNGLASGTLTFSEFVFYSNSQAANRTGITNNINAFYTIF